MKGDFVTSPRVQSAHLEDLEARTLHRDSGEREGYDPARSYHRIVTLCGRRLSGDRAQVYEALHGAHKGTPWYVPGVECARCARRHKHNLMESLT
jgi:hypothetical protein